MLMNYMRREGVPLAVILMIGSMRKRIVLARHAGQEIEEPEEEDSSQGESAAEGEKAKEGEETEENRESEFE